MCSQKVTSKDGKTRVKYAKTLEMINPHAAGLDLHKEKIWACASSDHSDSQIQVFGTCTEDVRKLGQWLKKLKINSVAMESTGVYWVPVYNILSSYGIKPVLVNAREIKGVKGRPKTDRLDCMWICRLHSYGLLRGSFVPPLNVAALKNLCDCREKIINESARVIQRMQKVLQMMNCRLDTAFSNVVGDSGIRIIKAILAGERNPKALASLSDIRVEKEKDQIARELDGDFREELLIVLEEWFIHYKFYIQRLEEISEKIYALLKKFPKKSKCEDLPKKAANYRENKMIFSNPLRPLFFEIFGTDLTQLTSIGPGTLLSLLATIGPDVSSWPTENHFVSWLGFAPNPQISADYRKKGKTKRVKNLLATSLKVAAMTAQKTDSFLGAFHRRLKSRIGPSKAKNATARKMAIILYRLLKNGDEAIKFSAEKYEQLYKKRKLKNLKRQLNQLGYTLVKNEVLNA
jgi:transposase